VQLETTVRSRVAHTTRRSRPPMPLSRPTARSATPLRSPATALT